MALPENFITKFSEKYQLTMHSKFKRKEVFMEIFIAGSL